MRLARALLRELLPKGLPLVPGAMGLIVLAVWALLSLAMLLDPLEDSSMIGASAAVGAVLFGPVAGVLFGVAGLLERRRLARAAWFASGAFVVGAAGILLGAAFALEPWYENNYWPDSESLGLGVFGGTCCGFTPACILLLPALVSGVRGVRELLGGTTARAMTAVVDLLHSRGSAEFSELAAAAGIAVDRVEGLLFELRKRRHFPCRIEARHHWACTQRHEHEQVRALSGLVAARGRIGMGQLCLELRAPEVVVRSWIYEAVGAGDLHGYIDWSQGLIYSREAEALRTGGQCPSCAGRLELVGRGVVRCPYCDAEIFI